MSSKIKYLKNNQSGKTGTLSEYKVALDLMKRGYDLFKPVTMNYSCDLLALKNDKFSRIEVTTGHKTALGKVSYSKHNPDNYDVLVVVVGEELFYIPAFSQDMP